MPAAAQSASSPYESSVGIDEASQSSRTRLVSLSSEYVAAGVSAVGAELGARPVEGHEVQVASLEFTVLDKPDRRWIGLEWVAAADDCWLGPAGAGRAWLPLAGRAGELF
jgi:hypothetical protein